MSLPLSADAPLAREAAGLDACVHCGFCLTSCPTYLALEDENDSPRGRLVLMRAMLDGELALDDPVAGAHIDRCLGCRACETACPSGVPYGHLLEATRATMVGRRPLPIVARAILFVFARPTLLGIALTLARVVRATGIAALIGRLRTPAAFPFAMLASTRRPGGRAATTAIEAAKRVATSGETATAQSPARGSVTLLKGCVMEGLFAPVNRATESVLVANGYAPTRQQLSSCCGALHAHAGDRAAAQVLARRNIAEFERSGAEQVVVNAAGCGAMMKDYAHLLADDPAWSVRAAAFSARVRDVSELLADAGPRRTRLSLRVTYDAPCHLQHAQRVVAPPLAVLGAIDGLEHVPLAGSDQCCGSAGIYNLVEPDVASSVLEPKLRAISSTGAPIVVTGNPGCLMQIGAGLLRARVETVARHPVELLAEAYAREALPAGDDQGMEPTLQPARPTGGGSSNPAFS